MTNKLIDKDELLEIIIWFEGNVDNVCKSLDKDSIISTLHHIKEAIEELADKPVDVWCYDMGKAPKDGTSIIAKCSGIDMYVNVYYDKGEWCDGDDAYDVDCFVLEPKQDVDDIIDISNNKHKP